MNGKIAKKTHIRYSWADRIFLAADWLLLTLFLILLAYPLLFIIMSSFSGGTAYMNLSLIPSKFSLEGYKAVFEHSDIWVGYKNSVIYTALYTVISLAVTVCWRLSVIAQGFWRRENYDGAVRVHHVFRRGSNSHLCVDAAN